jgi:hypothetical protein
MGCPFSIIPVLFVCQMFPLPSGQHFFSLAHNEGDDADGDADGGAEEICGCCPCASLLSRAARFTAISSNKGLKI